MSSNLVPLGDIAEDIRTGFACGEEDSSGVVQFRMNNVLRDGSLDWSKLRRVPIAETRSDLKLLPGDILFNATNSPELVGKTGLFVGFDEDVTFSNHFIRIRTKPKVARPDYISRWLQREFLRGTFTGMCRQWVNQASISKDILLSLSLPLPPLDEQRRIAAILDKADALCRKCKRTLDLLNGLTESIFAKMFGDPCSSTSQWKRRPINEICAVITGNTPSRKEARYYGPGIEWIKSDNIDLKLIYVTRAVESLSEEGRKVARIAPAGSTLITCIAGSPGVIGNASMTDRAVAFNQQINALVPKHIDPVFLYYQIKVGKRLVQEASTDSMKGLVTKSKLEKVLLVIPPLEIQEEFSRRIKCLDLLTAQYRIRRAKSDSIFASLQHRAFSGQL